ncbi:8-oxo-dGTP diphosphatase [Anaerobranca californiensis DSM 14826]|jgi:8-oxo-dGTP diphosphatase|uniref:8-oxo-dGTP diphosphatase n=2 Tax=Anaerobranca TaxID=42447 RepID=A0A1M6NSC5_9FIRM|nr:8-oxo-dGTP diphosphatase [Anaerobranca californiensis DSM 14826]
MEDMRGNITIQQSKLDERNKELEVCAAIIIERDRILIAQRPLGDSLENLWEFPGGKVEKGETPEQSLKREIFEELGIEILVGDFFGENTHNYGDKVVKIKSYLCSILSGHPTEKFHQKVLWVSVEGLNEYLFAPADIPFIRKIQSYFVDYF